MTSPAEVVGSWIRRANEGDQIAQAALLNVGEKARAGDSRFKPYYAAALAYYKKSATSMSGEAPAGAAKKRWWHFGRDSRIVVAHSAEMRAPLDPEEAKPPVPRGAFERLGDLTLFPTVITEACKYRHGLDGAAAVLSTGPALDDAAVTTLSAQWSGPSADAFVHGVRFNGDVLPTSIDPTLRGCLLAGQCVGRARRMQMIRMGGKLGGTAGWEMGE